MCTQSTSFVAAVLPFNAIRNSCFEDWFCVSMVGHVSILILDLALLMVAVRPKLLPVVVSRRGPRFFLAYRELSRSMRPSQGGPLHCYEQINGSRLQEVAKRVSRGEVIVIT